MKGLVNGKWTSASICKIGDFGCSILQKHFGCAPGGTMFYQALECVKRQPATSQADVWSFGFIMLNLVCWKTEKELFEKLSFLRKSNESKEMIKFFSNSARIEEFVKSMIPEGLYLLYFLDLFLYHQKKDIPSKIVNMIIMCLKPNQHERPDFPQISGFFHKILMISAIPGVESKAFKFWERWFSDEMKCEESVLWNAFKAAVMFELDGEIDIFQQNKTLFQNLLGW